MDNMEIARQIALAARAAGGQAFYVGGFVRDRLMGKCSKDVDIEVHGLDEDALYSLLRGLGEPMEVGASFSVFGLKGYSIDIALPRTERLTGLGHRDFDVTAAPHIGTYAAALRRDFTVNAMMEDILTGEVIDHFGGKEDLHQGILRHVSRDSFPEDPLRVLRGAQFAARFGFSLAEETMSLCSAMPLKHLPRERVMEEVKKALLQAPRPSVFFEMLRQMAQLEPWFPELTALIGVEQDPRHHPEGDVWQHTMAVLDAAAKLRSEAQNPLGLMLSALCHDIGKPAATTADADGKIHSYQHEQLGVPIAEEFITRLTGEVAIKAYVLNMVLLHMQPNIKASQNAGVKSTNRMFDQSLCPKDLLLLSQADKCCRGWDAEYENTRIFLQERLKIYEETMSRPYVMGRDLIEAGFAPGEYFASVLEYAHKLRLAGVAKETALKQVIAMARRTYAQRHSDSL